jgi:hypothetical protein
MKILSYLCLILAIVFIILAILGRFFFEARIIIHFSYFLKGAQIALLAAIAFALYHLIKIKAA